MLVARNKYRMRVSPLDGAFCGRRPDRGTSLAVKTPSDRANRHRAARVDEQRPVVAAIRALCAVKARRGEQGRRDWARGDGADAAGAGVEGEEERGQAGVVLCRRKRGVGRQKKEDGRCGSGSEGDVLETTVMSFVQTEVKPRAVLQERKASLVGRHAVRMHLKRARHSQAKRHRKGDKHRVRLCEAPEKG